METRPDVGKLFLSWQDVHRDCLALAARLPAKPWRGIVAVARGGLIPSTIIAHHLNLRHIETIAIASYATESTVRGQLQILNTLQGVGEGWLVVDDLVDTGETALMLKKLLPYTYLATVYAKPEGQAHADIFLKEIPQKTWVVFPWEVSL